MSSTSNVGAFRNFSTKSQIVFQNAKPKQESTLTESKNDAALQTSFAKKGWFTFLSQFIYFIYLFKIKSLVYVDGPVILSD